MSDDALRRLLLRISLATPNPVWWFECMPLRELFIWADVICDELRQIREATGFGQND